MRRVAALLAIALSLPTCLLVDLNGLSRTSSGDGGSASGGPEGGETGDAPAGADARDAPMVEANGSDVVTDVAMDVGAEDGEAGTLSYAATVLSDGPIAYWRLDDTTTATAKDYSGNGYDGSYQGGVTLEVPGAIADDPDTAVQFDGNTGKMVANLPTRFEFAGTAAYSIEVWAKPTSSSAGMGILGKSVYTSATSGYSGWYVAYTSNGYLDNWRNNDEAGNPQSATGTFMHVVATYDGTTLYVYLNGQPFANAATTTTLATTGAPLTAGSVANWGNFTGVLDEIAIYDKALSQARIAAHYARGTGQ
jgi:hypothetical protein